MFYFFIQMETETYAFQAEINQLLSLIINTFYTKKDIFLRELISNASDALDKIRYESLTHPEVLKTNPDLFIRLFQIKDAKTIVIRDSGIGMTKNDLIKCLGTIAHSGTKSFMEALSTANKQDPLALIGQFGVGFYAAFLVADKVIVRSKHNDDQGYIWTSTAGGSFTISPDPEPLSRGTEIQLVLKEDQLEFLEENRIRDIVKTHSSYINFPIEIQVEKEVEIEPETEADADTEGEVTDVKETTKKEIVKQLSWECLNSQKPIWTRKPEDVTQQEYAAFYKSFSQDWEDHLDIRHFKVDGQLEFTALLYLPKRAPFDMFQSKDTNKKNIKLYVRRVFITDECNELIPEYLSFVKGIVDSDDLPLNISRELLQQNKIIKVIRKNIVKKCFDMFNEIAEDKEKYLDFYTQFSKALKLGVHEDSNNRDKLVELLRFNSTKSNDITSLQDYVTRMKEGQKAIYYITGEDIHILKNSPCIEVLKKKGYEVLLMIDPIDEYVMQNVREYKEHKMICCSKEGLEIDEEISAEVQDKYKPLCDEILSIIGNNGISKVILSTRVDNTPCVIVSDQYGWSANMERIMKAQTLHDNKNMAFMRGQRILEINHNHPIIQELHDIQIKKNSSLLKKLVTLMYDTAILSSGFSIQNPSDYASRIFGLILNGLGAEQQQDQEQEQVHDITEQEPDMEQVD
jgi:molecular chaperone HtpG